MDIHKALAILNLKSDACLEDARISFRTLAKKYHPDKLLFNSIPASGNEKMKDINIAFHFLKTHLKPKKISTPKKEEFKQKKYKSPEKKTSGESFSSLFKKVYKSFFSSPAPKPRRQYKKTVPKFKSHAGSKGYSKRENYFESVLNKTISGSPDIMFNNPSIKKPKKKINKRNTYSSYMELKHKMRPKRKQTKIEGFTPIEKISPISSISNT